jgi:hypothetical protein
MLATWLEPEGSPNMKSQILITLSGLLFLLLTASSAQAQQDYFVDITNQTGFTIFYMYVSPADAKDWEEDVLGNAVLMNGDTKRVHLYNYFSPMFDIRLIDEDGDTYTFWNVDVSLRDVIVTLADIDAR